MFCSHEEAERFKYHKTDSLSEKNLSANKFHSVGKVFCIDLSARLSMRSLILALLTVLTSAECTLSASGVTYRAPIVNVGEHLENQPHLFIAYRLALIRALFSAT